MRANSTYAPARWLLPLVAVVVVSLITRWLSWPGLATHDTVWSTREAFVGRYTTYHPLLNALLLRALAVPFDSYAVYSSLQIGLCATLFYRSIRLVAGDFLSKWPVWSSIALWGLSLHTYLYLGMIWKDVPLAYCLCFIAALAYGLRARPEMKVGRLDATLLGASVFLCVGLRHGMAFNLVLVPAVLGLPRFRRDPRLWLPWAIALAGFMGLAALSQSSLVRNDEAHFLKLKISSLSQPFLGVVSNRNGYTSDDYAYDEALARRVFGPSYAEEYSPDYFRNTISSNSEDELRWAYKAIVLRTARLCMLNLSPCISGRLQMMLGTLQPSTTHGGMTFYDLGSQGNCGAAGMDQQRCDLLSRFASTEKPASAQQALAWLVPRFVQPKGATSNLLVWNLFPALALIVVLLIWLGPRRPLWIVAAFFAVESLLPFASAMANDFRYYYFLSPFFAVFAPVFLREVIEGRHARQGGVEPAGDPPSTQPATHRG